MSIFSILLISGCNDNSVNTVKESINYSINNTLTIGKALDSRTDCINGKWNSLKDNRDRVIVTYSCELPQHYLDMYMSNREGNNLKSLNAHITVNNNEIKVYQQQITQYKAKQQIINELFIPYLNVHKDSIEKISQFNGLERLNYSYYKLENGWDDKMLSQEEFCSNYKNAAPDVKELCYKWYAVYQLKYSLLDDFIKLSKGISIDKNEIQYSVDDLSRILNKTLQYGNGLSVINDYIKDSEDDALRNIKEWTQRVNEQNEDIDRVKDALTKVKDNAHIDKVSEIFSWYVLDNGSIQEINGGFAITHNGDDIQVPMNERYDRFLSFAYHDFSDNGIPNAYVDIINNALHPNN